MEVASIIAGRNGFTDVDCEPTGDAKGFKITVSNTKAKLTVRGPTLALACEKLVEELW